MTKTFVILKRGHHQWLRVKGAARTETLVTNLSSDLCC